MAVLAIAAGAQTMSFEEYDPPSSLVVPEHELTRAKYPFIDVHSHQSLGANYERLSKEMDAMNMRVMVNLSGRTGDALATAVRNAQGAAPGRFVFFANLQFSGIDDPNWGQNAATQLERDVKAGARGLKIFKNLGLDLKDGSGKRVPVDDARLDAVWRKAGELRIPVLIHTAEPRQFFQPHDKNNERWLELKQRPERARPPDEYPPWKTIIAEQHRVFRKHPRTIFINAHLGWLGGDLAHLGALMDSLPNMYTEIGAVLAELGRQPRFARQFLIKYQDRVLFGKDSYRPDEYHTYFRTLETADEYFPYYRRRHAFWRMYGLDLPDDVLKKIYYRNALRIIPGLDASAFPR
ncbi:MAG: amidohydrolase [Gemmatimonadota bacterium]|nr:amidohydrolase [Gemmatimonadota bacterium]